MNRHGDPLEPTIVFCAGEREFMLFCERCKVSRDSANVKWASPGGLTPFFPGGARDVSGFKTALRELPWKHVAFVGINPVSFYAAGPGSAWTDLEEMRRNKQFTRAFYYDTCMTVEPDVRDDER